MHTPAADTGWFTPDWPAAANVGSLVTTRHGGVSPAPYASLNLGDHVGDDAANVAANRALLRAVLPAEPAWLQQVHGITVVDAASVAPGSVPVADASFSRTPGAVCAVMTADCLPVLLADRAGTVVGAAHAGWRGLANGVLESTVDAMRAAGAGELTAWLGPAIGPYQFEVGHDVPQAFLKHTHNDTDVRHVEAAFSVIPGKPDKRLADIYALARHRLHRAGVARVSGGEFCTVSNSGRFYSFRRDGVTGRQATLIWIK